MTTTAPPEFRPLPYIACYGDLYDAAWGVLTATPNLGTSTTIHRLLAAVLPIFEKEIRGTGPSVWVYLDDDGRMSAHAFPTEAQARDAAAGDYLTCQPVEAPGWERPELFWRAADDGTYDLLADGYPTCYTLHRLPVYGAPTVPRPEADAPLEAARRWRTVGPHPAPGQDTPTHPGPGETCTDAACVKSRAQHESAGRIQDLSYAIFDGESVDGPANPESIADTNDAH